MNTGPSNQPAYDYVIVGSGAGGGVALFDNLPLSRRAVDGRSQRYSEGSDRCGFARCRSDGDTNGHGAEADRRDK